MDTLNAVPNAVEDLKHAHAMLARMSPEELLVATYAMEDILDGAVYVTNLHEHEEDELIDDEERLAAEQGRNDLAAGRTGTMEDLLAICGLTMDDLATEPRITEPTKAHIPEVMRAAA